jgi:lipid-A-disaccharide synthase-like uncharacterized protein
MPFTEIIGWAGFALLIIAWVPQTFDTIKAGRTEMNIGFILLYVLSSMLLTVYAVLTNDAIFIALNGLLTVGSGINLYYKFLPRKKDG